MKNELKPCNELLPCPFCGNNIFQKIKNRFNKKYVLCCKCGGKAPLDIWDTRPTPFENEKLINLEEEELEKFMDEMEESYIHNNPIELNRKRFLIKSLCARFGTKKVSVEGIRND